MKCTQRYANQVAAAIAIAPTSGSVPRPDALGLRARESASLGVPYWTGFGPRERRVSDRFFLLPPAGQPGPSSRRVGRHDIRLVLISWTSKGTARSRCLM